jgi:putative sigma-54 modulation protein
MKLIYSGKTKEFTPELEEKVGGKLSKLSKMIEQRGEREAHVTHHLERHLHKIKIKVQFYDHVLLGEGSDPDLEACLCGAIEKLETQIIELRKRWRETHRDAKGVRSTKEAWDQVPADATASAAVKVGSETTNGNGRRPKIFRVNYDDGRKPMTLDEAILEAETESDYLVYRDSSKNCLSVLVRREDGNFDLIES